MMDSDETRHAEPRTFVHTAIEAQDIDSYLHLTIVS